MDSVEVLDTAALLAWPVERMRGGLVVPGQRSELLHISPDRELVLEAAELIWETPSEEALAKARELATTTGDMAGLSSVDFEILALAVERGATLFTDDYRLQNLCELAGIAWSSVMTEFARCGLGICDAPAAPLFFPCPIPPRQTENSGIVENVAQN